MQFIVSFAADNGLLSLYAALPDIWCSMTEECELVIWAAAAVVEPATLFANKSNVLAVVARHHTSLRQNMHCFCCYYVVMLLWKSALCSRCGVLLFDRERMQWAWSYRWEAAAKQVRHIQGSCKRRNTVWISGCRIWRARHWWYWNHFLTGQWPHSMSSSLLQNLMIICVTDKVLGPWHLQKLATEISAMSSMPASGTIFFVPVHDF